MPNRNLFLVAALAWALAATAVSFVLWDSLRLERLRVNYVMPQTVIEETDISKTEKPFLGVGK